MPISSVSKAILGRSFTLKLDHGIDEKGKNIYKNKSFSNVSDDASDADILNTANALADLQDKVLAEVSLQEKNVLIG